MCSPGDGDAKEQQEIRPHLDHALSLPESEPDIWLSFLG